MKTRRDNMSRKLSDLKNIVLTALALAIILSPNAALAETSSSSNSDSSRTPKPVLNKFPEKESELKERQAKLATKASELKDRKEEIASKAAAMREDRCKLITQRIDLNITRYENSKLEHVTNYQNAKKRLQETITRLKKDGLDTTKLEQDAIKLDELIKQFAADYTAYITALKNSKAYTCGKSEGEFKDALEDVRPLLIKSKQSALAIRMYYQNTIRVDFLALKAKKASSTAKPTPKATTPVSTSSAQ
jgi:hypothetical protein